MKQKGITVGTYINKQIKAKSNMSVCPTCQKCKNKVICDNRKNLKNCTKCKNCKDVENCDKFYIHVQHKATLTVGKDIDTKETIRKTFTGKTEEEALDKLYKYKLEMQKAGKTFDLRKTEKTIATLGEELEESKYRKGKTKGNGYCTNMATLKRIKKEKFAHIPINKVTIEQIENFLEKERIKSNSIIKKDFHMIKKIFECALDNMYITADFFARINRIEVPKSQYEDKNVKALTLSEQHLLVDYLEKNNSKYKNIILLALHTGMRIGEILSLDRDNIDLNSKQIYVNTSLTKDKNGKTIVGSPKTRNGIRIIQINEFTKGIIEEALKINYKSNPYNLLFCHENGDIIVTNTVNSSFKRICKNAGIIEKVNFHCLRHTFATRCIEAGIDLPVLKALMGHASIETTINQYGNIYKYLEIKEHQKYVDYLNQEQEKR